MTTTLRRFEGFRVLGERGTLGRVRDAYFEDHIWAVRYLAVARHGRRAPIGWLSPHSIVRVDRSQRTIVTDLTVAQWRVAAHEEADTTTGEANGHGLLRYYGFPYSWGGPEQTETPHWPPTPAPAAELHLHSEREFRHYIVHALDGELGHVDDLVIDEHSWAVRYLVVDTRHWRPGGRVLVAPEWVIYVSWLEHSVHTSLEREAVRTAPHYDRRRRIDRAYEARLRQHYGRPTYWEGHAA